MAGLSETELRDERRKECMGYTAMGKPGAAGSGVWCMNETLWTRMRWVSEGQVLQAVVLERESALAIRHAALPSCRASVGFGEKDVIR